MRTMDITTIITITMMENITIITTITMMEKITIITTIIMMEKIIITIIMAAIMATITTIWTTGDRMVINKGDVKGTLLQIKSVFIFS